MHEYLEPPTQNGSSELRWPFCFNNLKSSFLLKPFEKFKAFISDVCTVFENHRKSLIQHCERSELRLHFEWTKVKGQKLVENAKIENFKCDIFSNFQTMCVCLVKSIDPFSSPASSS